MCKREQNHHFLGHLREISVIKIEVAAIREATLALFSYMINYFIDETQ